MSTLSTSSSLILNEDIDHLVTLCSYISLMASRIRLMHLTNVSFSPEYIKLYHQKLLSMFENIEGSALLLESLLAVEEQKPVPIEMKKPRYTYTREELLKLRQYVTPSLSVQTKNSLNQIIKHESNHSIIFDNKSWKNIRTILT